MPYEVPVAINIPLDADAYVSVGVILLLHFYGSQAADVPMGMPALDRAHVVAAGGAATAAR